MKIILVLAALIVAVPVVCFIGMMVLLQMGLNNKFGDDEREEMRHYLRERAKDRSLPFRKRLLSWLASVV